MAAIRPRYITFDCYGTLTRFQIRDLTRVRFAKHVAADCMEAFLADFAAYRRDEVIGAWKPYRDVLTDALARACERWRVPFDEADGHHLYEAVPTWGPHNDVPAPLAAVSDHYPLVILSNAMNEQIQANVDALGAPFHRVLTAEQAGAYKPRLRAFEYMFDTLGCAPEELLHVSSSIRYDLMPATDLGIRARLYINRGYEPSTPFYAVHESPTLAGLPALLGLN